MYKRSIMFRCAPLFCSCSICIVLRIGPKECVCSIGCLAMLEEWLAVLKEFLYSLKHVAKLLSVSPTYAFPQSGHVQLYTPDCECISVFCCLFIDPLGSTVFITILNSQVRFKCRYNL